VSGRAILIALIAGCAAQPRAPASPRPPAPRAVTAAGATGAEPSVHIRAAAGRESLIDATFDQEARGARPVWTPPPAVEGGIGVSLDSLEADARRCFAGALAPTVDVTFTVTAAGRAADILVESRYPTGRACLAAAIRDAVFPLSARAWRVAYVFRP